MDGAPQPEAPSRQVFQADALVWLRENVAPEGASVVTSLPDVSELGQLDLAAWRTWFIDAASAVIRWVPEDGVAIFYQTDVRIAGAWIDKGYLVMRAAEDAGAELLWHKIVCRSAPGTSSFGRPRYAHMLAFSRSRASRPERSRIDVMPDAGFMPWSKAMGVDACREACRFLCDETSTRVVVDPFCGRGTVLAIANDMGLDAIGVDVGGKRCRVARNLTITELEPH